MDLQGYNWLLFSDYQFINKQYLEQDIYRKDWKILNITKKLFMAQAEL